MVPGDYERTCQSLGDALVIDDLTVPFDVVVTGSDFEGGTVTADWVSACSVVGGAGQPVLQCTPSNGMSTECVGVSMGGSTDRSCRLPATLYDAEGGETAYVVRLTEP